MENIKLFIDAMENNAMEFSNLVLLLDITICPMYISLKREVKNKNEWKSLSLQK